MEIRMSTFDGRLLEEQFEFIVVDDFQPYNHSATSFFLTHFHSDHYRGLFDDAFARLLEEDETKMIYCSELTKTFILRKNNCRIPANKIHPLYLNCPIIIFDRLQNPVEVTAISAGHCPGSVMFFFEHETTRVLCTGDFRVSCEDLMNCQFLFDPATGRVKRISNLYLDTTFCHTQYLSFPPRSKTENDIKTMAKNWMKKDKKNRIGIRYNSYYGLEPLLLALAQSLQMKIWILDNTAYFNYSCFSELAIWLTGSPLARIHMCKVGYRICAVCKDHEKYMLTIKPCAMPFDNEQLLDGRLKAGTNGVVRVCYATHCALDELIGVVKFLCPAVVTPCVVPESQTALQVLQYLNIDTRYAKRQYESEKIRKDDTEEVKSVIGDPIFDPSTYNFNLDRGGYWWFAKEESIQEKPTESMTEMQYWDLITARQISDDEPASQ